MTWHYIYYKIGETSFITMKLCQLVSKYWKARETTIESNLFYLHLFQLFDYLDVTFKLHVSL
jgi:hypothetical protein